MLDKLFKHIFYHIRGVAYECRFSIEQTVESGASVMLSAEMNPAPNYAAIATSISSSTEITTVTGKYF